jgi:hypothetical protein
MQARHGDLPFYISPEEPSEEWKLYEALSGPLEPCGPDCDVACVCDEDEDDE